MYLKVQSQIRRSIIINFSLFTLINLRRPPATSRSQKPPFGPFENFVALELSKTRQRCCINSTESRVECSMHRFRSKGTLPFGSLAIPHLKKKALNSWSAVQDTYFTTKDLFERHRVVFTVGTSLASVATAWVGYSLRHLRDSKVDQRLESIENAMKSNYHLEHAEFKKLVDPGSSSVAACIATAGTTFVVGYGFGWRGGRWYANRKYRKEQMKLLGQIKPKRWQLLARMRPKEWQFQFIKRGFPRYRASECEAYGKRSMLYSVKGLDVVTALAPSASDGICKTLVEIHGYPCEEHTVTTQDGFILGLQRIPGGAAGGTPGNKTPVLLQHGILMDGAVWVMLPPGQSLAFLLADNGFDVWLANARGTESSSGHTSLRPNDPAFWNWSWDELAGFDLPATFQYVHNQTGQQLHYVAHSLGTLTALSAFSKNQLLDMMRSAALIGPVAYMGQITSPVAKVAADVLTGNTSFWLGVAEFDPMGSMLGVFLSHGPQSTATKNLIHQSQMIKKGTITMYDYNNEDENKKHYGQPTPPVYDMTHIPNDVPLFLGCGAKDALSDTKDVQLLLDNLKDHVKDKLVVQTIENYAHVDFIFAENVKQIIYDPLIAFVKLH
ncbi:hypothetical protein GH714_020276 [Hevea brasiliensis]|uniref:Partial AB-hydrolase lipase domain-containing protein n=1 Tax=Hevea brasiliensis TaxID=3981 RepID=A0A6A6KY09_HEVBR|nr:hypothetical protein GH714_020276 [Hevea brasiliensis]